MRFVPRAGGVTALAALGLALVPTVPVQADASDSPSAIPCSVAALIDAIDAANAAGGGTIQLARKCVYRLVEVNNVGPSGDANGLPVIITPITIKGGKDSVIERSTAVGVPDFRIFEVADPAGALTLDGEGRGGDGWGTASMANDVLAQHGIDRGRGDSELVVRNGSTTDEGGAVFVGEGRSLTLKSTVLTRNHADDAGGAVFAADGSTVVVSRSSVDKNTADGAGGGIAASETEVRLNSSSVDRNIGELGGGIATEGGTLSLRSTTVNKNRATDDVGGVFTNNTPATFIRSEINENVAVGEAGGLFIVADPGIVTNFDRVEVKGNVAANAGGLVTSGITTIENSSITKNTANDDGGVGGGIVNLATLNVENTVIKENKATAADSQGGGLYNDDGTATLTDSKVVRNRAADGGGIFEEPGTTVDLVRTKVKDNEVNNCAPAGAVPGCID
ncbi:hypothetical protein [Streptomyces sp. NPDC055709]